MTNREQLECLCDHLTAFAGGLLVMPNDLNLKEDIAMFLTFWENPVGIIAVSVVIGIYIIVLPFARRKDREDEVKVTKLSNKATKLNHACQVCSMEEVIIDLTFLPNFLPKIPKLNMNGYLN